MQTRTRAISRFVLCGRDGCARVALALRAREPWARASTGQRRREGSPGVGFSGLRGTWRRQFRCQTRAAPWGHAWRQRHEDSEESWIPGTRLLGDRDDHPEEARARRTDYWVRGSSRERVGCPARRRRGAVETPCERDWRQAVGVRARASGWGSTRDRRGL